MIWFVDCPPSDEESKGRYSQLPEVPPDAIRNGQNWESRGRWCKLESCVKFCTKMVRNHP